MPGYLLTKTSGECNAERRPNSRIEVFFFLETRLIPNSLLRDTPHRQRLIPFGTPVQFCVGFRALFGIGLLRREISDRRTSITQSLMDLATKCRISGRTQWHLEDLRLLD